jgi:mannobiose 2-epimerase
MLYETIQQFSQAVRNELHNNLVPFWLDKSVDSEYGGFIGQMSNDGTINPEATKDQL